MPLDLVLEDGEKKELKSEQLEDLDASTPNSTGSPKVSEIGYLHVRTNTFHDCSFLVQNLNLVESWQY